MTAARYQAPQSYRQGDVLLVPCGAIPSSAHEENAEDGRVVLAHGERTGHAHIMPADRVCYFRDDGNGQAFLHVAPGEPVALTHEEHAPLDVEPGTYRIILQREYQPRSALRAVVD
jgi:hypothetical protein